MWKNIAGTVAELGLPMLGTALGIPGPVSAFAVKLVKKALGLPADASEDDINSTIAGMDPDVARSALEGAQSEVVAKYEYLKTLAEVQGRVAERGISEVNKTMRAELGKVSWWHWRHLLGYVPFIIGVEIASLLPLVVLGKITAADMGAIITAVTPFMAIICGLLGYVAQDTSSQKIAAVTGEMREGVIVSTAKALGGLRKK